MNPYSVLVTTGLSDHVRAHVRVSEQVRARIVRCTFRTRSSSPHIPDVRVVLSTQRHGLPLRQLLQSANLLCGLHEEDTHTIPFSHTSQDHPQQHILGPMLARGPGFRSVSWTRWRSLSSHGSERCSDDDNHARPWYLYAPCAVLWLLQSISVPG